MITKRIKISSIICFIIVAVSLVLIFLSNYISTVFDNVSFEQLLYSFKNAEGTSNDIIINGIKYVLPKTLFLIFIYLFIRMLLKAIIKDNWFINIKFKNKTIKISLFPFGIIMNLIIMLFFLFITVTFTFDKLKINEYIHYLKESSFIETNYVDPKQVSVSKDKKTNNLIYIYVESLETSMFSNENGGNFDKSVIPYLESLARNNISFSNNDLLGGAYVPYGATWTIAGMVGTTAGVPLKVLNEQVDYLNENYLEGAYSLGDILQKNGYKNYLLLGSDGNFAKRKQYFQNHGNYVIHDYNYAKKHKWIDKDYYVWWGIEDKKLFKFAKKDLLKVAKNNKKFNYTLLTTNTHATDGYKEKNCPNPYKNNYLNAYNCSDVQLKEFINWIMTQDSLKDSTIVITGDHLSMQRNIFELYDADKTYDRKLYNVFINSKAKTKSLKNRKFTTFDIYPTTLTSLGFKIEGNRLGLGTNLFSNKKTLLEKMSSYEEYEEQLKYKSNYYNKYILKNNDK